jgi:hypothetical protein
MARYLRGAPSYGPEFVEQFYIFRIPTHGSVYTPTANYRLVDSRLGSFVRGACGLVAPALFTALQPFDDLVVNAMHCGGKVLVGELRSHVAHDDIAIGAWVGLGSVITRRLARRCRSPRPTSALVRIPHSSRASREVRKIAKAQSIQLAGMAAG